MNTDPTSKINLTTTIPDRHIGKRLDQSLALLFSNYSRENIKQWLLQGECLVDGAVKLPKYRIKGGEVIKILAVCENKTPDFLPENLPIEIIYEDPELLIINKPNNLVVHPGAGNWHGTLLNRLIHYLPDLRLLPRAGIVHRLDQDTTGIMVIAKTLIAYNHLIQQFKHRNIAKIYEAIVHGRVIGGGVINAPIGRHRYNRLKMQVNNNGKTAITEYQVLRQFNNFTHVSIRIITGRTHQIRVHFQYINHPILGDPLYGVHHPIFSKLIDRQALHAKSITLVHPIQKVPLTFTVNLPDDFNRVLECLHRSTF